MKYNVLKNIFVEREGKVVKIPKGEEVDLEAKDTVTRSFLKGKAIERQEDY